MKKLLVLLVAFTAFSLVAKADPWDNLTEAQAKAVVEYLEDNPFILDYCDCCDDSDVYLLKVLSTEIVPCEWDTEQKSVRVSAVRIGQLERTGAYPSAYRTEAMYENVDYTIEMNYTFVYSECGKWAVPFFKEVPYSNNHVCVGATRFPNPNENNIEDAEYKAWFKDKGME